MTVDTHTGEIVEAHLSATDARTLTDRIRGGLSVAYDGLVQAWEGRADLALGYESWDAYCAGEFTEGRMVRLDREQRREIVSSMRAAGMSTRAIGAGLGVPQSTVDRDVRSTDPNGSVEPASVTSLDGRTRPATRPPREQTADEARAISNRVYSKNLAECVWLLATFGMHDDAATVHAANWDASQDIYPEPVTPARMRRAAAYLISLADAWEQS